MANSPPMEVVCTRAGGGEGVRPTLTSTCCGGSGISSSIGLTPISRLSTTVTIAASLFSETQNDDHELSSPEHMII